MDGTARQERRAKREIMDTMREDIQVVSVAQEDEDGMKNINNNKEMIIILVARCLPLCMEIHASCSAHTFLYHTQHIILKDTYPYKL